MQELSCGEPREHRTGRCEGEPVVTVLRSGHKCKQAPLTATRSGLPVGAAFQEVISKVPPITEGLTKWSGQPAGQDT